MRSRVTPPQDETRRRLGRGSGAGITAGGAPTCGISSTGMACGRGGKREGQPGDGTDQRRTAPAPASGGASYVQLEAGPAHTCGLTAPGAGCCQPIMSETTGGAGSVASASGPGDGPHGLSPTVLDIANGGVASGRGGFFAATGEVDLP